MTYIINILVGGLDIMKKIYQKRFVSILLISFLILTFTFLPIDAQHSQKNELYKQTCQHSIGYIDVTVQEVWEMCSSTDNGITLPVDVRTTTEWLSSRIDTPFPEFTRQYVLSSLQTQTGMQNFLEEYNGKNVILYCKSGGRSSGAALLLVQNNFNGTIYNMIGGITAWIDAGLPTKYGNTQPDQPLTPTGSTICGIGLVQIFETTGIDPDDDVLRYGWDMNNDNNVDVWTGYTESGEANQISYIWSESGEYHISVLAEDIVGTQSDFSSSLTITVSHPPSNPSIDGPTEVKTGKEQSFTFISTDTDGDDIYYLIDWGDGNSTDWLGPYDEGIIFEESHIWTTEDSYILRAKAKDSNDLESEWATLQISVPKQANQDKNLLYELSNFIRLIILNMTYKI